MVAAGAYDHSTNEMAQFLKKALRIEGPQLSQKTVTIRKNARESLGMRIGGGIGSNEGDTPIYIANIHPHGCIGKSKQMKVNWTFFYKRISESHIPQLQKLSLIIK